MAFPALDFEVENKVSTEGMKIKASYLLNKMLICQPAARVFTETYYAALNSTTERPTLATFYIQPTALSPLTADISLNGNLVPSPTDFQKIFATQMPPSHYEVQSYDCHVVNPDYNVGAPESDLAPDKTGRKMSILVIVSGYVKYFDGPEKPPMRGFTETFVLVPNFEAQKGDRNAKRWLIQSQNFRMVL